MGKIQTVKPKSKVGNSHSSCSSHRTVRNVWLTIATSAFLVGCGTIKKAGIVAIAAGTGAIAGTVLSGGVAAPILGATTTAFVVDVVTEVTDTTPTFTGADMSCAPDNFWTLLGSLIEMGGWLLILVVVAPMILGWILPGPLEKRKKRK